MAAITSTATHTQLHRVQTFLAVVELGSYTKAADYLNISKAMASLHVKALEEALSITLLVRSTRSVALTESGQQFYDEFKQIFGHIEAAFDNAQHGSRRARHARRSRRPSVVALVEGHHPDARSADRPSTVGRRRPRL